VFRHRTGTPPGMETTHWNGRQIWPEGGVPIGAIGTPPMPEFSRRIKMLAQIRRGSRFGAETQGMATSSLHLTMECRDAPAERPGSRPSKAPLKQPKAGLEQAHLAGGGPEVRIRFPPAGSLQTLGPSSRIGSGLRRLACDAPGGCSAGAGAEGARHTACARPRLRRPYAPG
jgi:hypothetical protein